MANEQKPAVSQQEPQKTVAESTAFDKNGKLQAGYAYRYETFRNDAGQRETRKVVFKVEK